MKRLTLFPMYMFIFLFTFQLTIFHAPVHVVLDDQQSFVATDIAHELLLLDGDGNDKKTAITLVTLMILLHVAIKLVLVQRSHAVFFRKMIILTPIFYQSNYVVRSRLYSYI
ncbi:hypothetical protein [Bacillus sp. CGMCC 1.16541]|uniref:hypothetical protein n=1 Tax=Bacillus sp. CGMCC 1.16541 TaxID=2185143 RepID=UPI000D72BD3E|nr:hypothetical protein [Bacillus sp. CGMCC 1.16541]